VGALGEQLLHEGLLEFDREGDQLLLLLDRLCTANNTAAIFRCSSSGGRTISRI
jgi:hypothetical protein